MTAAAYAQDTGEQTGEQEEGTSNRRDRLRGLGVATGAVATTVLLALIPLLFNSRFYYNNDTASQQIPMFFRIGTLLRGGTFPVLLDPNSWAGGNVAAEAQFGVFSPVTALTQVIISTSTDLLVAATLLKLAYLGVLTLGCHLLAREYGAPRWAAFVMSVALPFAGYTRYFDSSAWMTGLIAYAWVPLAWWAMRRAGRGRLNPIWAFVVGACAITVGNPYGLLAVVVVIAGLLVEFALRRDSRALTRTVLIGTCIGCLVPLVYLPLTGVGSVSVRQGLEAVGYSGALAPTAGDFAALSSPTYAPFLKTFGTEPSSNLPVTYLAWFVLPLLPWLRWRSIQPRRLAGPLAVTALFVTLALGPSELWLFRWPLRILQPGLLGLAVLLAVVLGAGLRSDHARRRALGSGLIVAGGFYLAWARQVSLWGWHLLAMVVVGALTAAAVAASRRGTRPLAVTLTAGTAIVLTLQSAVHPVNDDVAHWRLPHDVAALRSQFSDYRGETMQFVRPETLAASQAATFQRFLPGNAFLPAGVHMVNAYSGVGFREFTQTFCMTYLGAECSRAYSTLWRPTGLNGQSMAQLLRLQTIVVDNTLPFAADVHRPGWRVAERDSTATVLVREGPATPWTRGTLSYAAPALDIRSDSAGDSGRAETVVLGGSARGGTLAFARLDWPGYTATLNGRLIRVRKGPAGLLTVTIPAGADSRTLFLHYAPPHYVQTAALAGVGLLGAVLLGATSWFGRLRRRRRGGGAS